MQPRRHNEHDTGQSRAERQTQRARDRSGWVVRSNCKGEGKKATRITRARECPRATYPCRGSMSLVHKRPTEGQWTAPFRGVSQGGPALSRHSLRRLVNGGNCSCPLTNRSRLSDALNLGPLLPIPLHRVHRPWAVLAANGELARGRVHCANGSMVFNGDRTMDSEEGKVGAERRGERESKLQEEMPTSAPLAGGCPLVSYRSRPKVAS